MKKIFQMSTLSRKAILFLLGVGLFHSGVVQASSHWERPELLNLVPDQIYISNPFESNREVEILITGEFVNSCFRQGPVQVQVDWALKKIYLNNQVYFYKNRWCLQVTKSYSRSINLGTLLPGKYQIVAWDDQGVETELGGLSVLLAEEFR